jgi:ADP-heptose:LPS heptosyltransferase
MKKYPIRVFDSTTKFYKETSFFRYYRLDITLSSKIKLQILEVYFYFINGFIDLIRICLFKNISKNKIKNILIFRTGSIGDNVVALPAISAIRDYFPNAKISILTSTGKNNYISFENIASPLLYDNVINYSGNTLFSVRNEIINKYDLVIELPQFLHSIKTSIRNMIFFRFFCKIKSGFGWQVSNVNLFKNTQEENILYKNEVSVLSLIISKYLKIDFKRTYKFNITNSDKLKVEDLMDNLLSKSGHGFNVLIIGANYQRNRWPLENFIQIANKSYLVNSMPSIIVGSDNDNKLLEGVSLSNNIINLCGKLTIGQTAFLLSKAKKVFSNDTGPMHIAAALGVNLKAFFSCKDFPGRWFPDLSNSTIYRTFGVSCSICMKKSCHNNYCLSNISSFTEAM